MNRFGLAAIMLAFAPSQAVAGEAATPLEMAQQIFEAADSNDDGVLTSDEHDKAGLGRFGASFGDFDLDDDSRVTWAEYRALFERHHHSGSDRAA